MIFKRVLMSIVLLGIVFLGGCCTEQDCKDKYPNKWAEPGPPGPIIDLDPKPMLSEFNWMVNTVEQEPGLTVFDPSDADTYCKLREDFIGRKSLIFDFFLLDGSELTSPKRIELISTDGNISLEIKRDQNYKRLYWTLTKKDGLGVVNVCALEPGPITEGLVPLEFANFSIASLKETAANVAGKDIKIRVEKH